MTEQKKWYPRKLTIGGWIIETEDGDDILDSDEMFSEEVVERNAILCSKAPEMKELLDDIVPLLRNTAEYEIEIPSYRKVVERYKELCKELNG